MERTIKIEGTILDEVFTDEIVRELCYFIRFWGISVNQLKEVVDAMIREGVE